MAAIGFTSQTCATFKKPSPFPFPFPFPNSYFCFCRSFPYSTSRFSWSASRLLLNRYKVCEAIATDVLFSKTSDLGNLLEKDSRHGPRPSNSVYPLMFESDSVNHNTTISRLSLNQQLPLARKVSSTSDQYSVGGTPLHHPSWLDETYRLGKKKQEYKEKNGITCQSMQVGRNSDFKLTPNSLSTSTCFPSGLIADSSPVENTDSDLSVGMCVEEQGGSVSTNAIAVLTPVNGKHNGFPRVQFVEEQEERDSIADGDHDNDVVKRILNSEEYVETSRADDVENQQIRKRGGDIGQLQLRERLVMVYKKVLVVDTISLAKEVVSKLTGQYRHLVHACDTEVASIDVKLETPVDHGEIVCFSIYSGPDADFGNGKSCIWVDVLDGGGKKIVEEFAPFFTSPQIKKVWHNYSFDNHIIENYGLKVAGFHADTMHMARLWDSSRRTGGGYSLEALTGDSSVMSGTRLCPGEELVGNVSMKTIFGRKKLKKDGSEGKFSTIPCVEDLQTTERKLLICYSALGSISTLRLYESLKSKLSELEWELDGVIRGSMYNFYEKFWRAFGELLVKMETQGMQVDRAYLAKIEKVDIKEQQIAADRFCNWASKYCPDANYMNVGSDTQLRQLVFGGILNSYKVCEAIATDVPFSKTSDLGNLLEKDSRHGPRPSNSVYPLMLESDSVNHNTTISRLSLNQQLPLARKVSSTSDQYSVGRTPLHHPSWLDETYRLGKKKQEYKEKNGITCQSMQVGRNSDFKLTPNSLSTSTCFPSGLIADSSPVENTDSDFSVGLCVEEQGGSVSTDTIAVLPPVKGKHNGFPRVQFVEEQEERDSIADGDHDNDVVKSFLNSEEYVETSRADDVENQQIRKRSGDIGQLQLRERLVMVYKKVLVVDTVSLAKEVVSKLTGQYRHLVHACDTEVASIDVKLETPVDHGEIVCFSIYSGPDADFGNGKSCIWVDVLDGGGKKIVEEFAPFFASPQIKKVWHNYSFDNHIIENYGLKVAGFHADTMHMARLWDSSRRTCGGYSLEALTGDSSVMSGTRLCPDEELIGKVSMKTIFGRKKLKKNGSEGKISTIPSVEDLQTTERKLWICYSALDSISTLRLYESLKSKLSELEWELDGVIRGSMYNFYEKFWRAFGELLVKMETQGMLVDRAYLAKIEKVAIKEQQIAADRFRNWATKYCPDANYMNVGSDTQLRQLFFGGILNSRNHNEVIPFSKEFKVPNIDLVIEDGKKTPKKFRTITLHRIFDDLLETDMYTPSGWPSVSGDALKALAKQCAEKSEQLTSSEAKRELLIGAADAISALCEMCSIDSLISNFIVPLQGPHVAGKNQRIHCSLNINTETGRLSARRPNLQNQPALEKDRYKIRQAFIAESGNTLVVADYGQLELRILAHLANCKSMLDAFKAGGDFHSRTAMNMYSHIRQAVEQKKVLLEWYPQPGEDKPPVPLLKDAFASERRKAKMLNFSIAYGKTPVGLARDWKVSVEEAKKTVKLWYSDRKEVLSWQEDRKAEAREKNCVHTLLGRARHFPSQKAATLAHRYHIDRAAINTPVQGSAADVAMCAMLQISQDSRLKKLGWKLLLQIHDEVILEGPTESAEIAKDIVVECMSKPFGGKNILNVDLAVDAKCAQNWYAAK